MNSSVGQLSYVCDDSSGKEAEKPLKKRDLPARSANFCYKLKLAVTRIRAIFNFGKG